MMRLVRSLCLACFAVLAIVVVIAIAEFVAPNVIMNAAGCHWSGDVLPNFTCREGVLQRPTELLLNVPILFVLAPVSTLVGPAMPNPALMLLLYAFDGILVLALAHPVFALLAARRVKTAK
jgi:hypothetical protein